jgi:hypothetical protein
LTQLSEVDSFDFSGISPLFLSGNRAQAGGRNIQEETKFRRLGEFDSPGIKNVARLNQH